jgi:hypothetical protein
MYSKQKHGWWVDDEYGLGAFTPCATAESAKAEAAAHNRAGRSREGGAQWGTYLDYCDLRAFKRMSRA